MEKDLRKRAEWNVHGGTWVAGEMGVHQTILSHWYKCFITKSGGGGQEVRASRDHKGKRGG